MKRARPILQTKFSLPVALLLAASAILFSQAARAQASRHAQAKAQYEKAQQMRQALEAEPQDSRTLAEYKKAVSAYRRVYLLTASAPETTLALQAVAQLYHDMGDQFDPTYYQSSLVTYKFLVAQYPANKFRANSLFQIGKIEQDDLREKTEAKNAFTQYLQRFPHAEQADDARKALQEIAAMPAKTAVNDSREVNSPGANQDERMAGDAAAPKPVQVADETADAPKKGEPSSVTAIRTWNAEDYTRVVVDMNGAVKYQAARIKNPDRIYFDLYKARLGHSLTDKAIPAQTGFLKGVRVAQNKAGVVRLVLDVQDIEGYSAFLLPNPYRLVIDVHGVVTTASAKKTPVEAGPARLAGDRPAVNANAVPPTVAAEKVDVPVNSQAQDANSAGPDTASSDAGRGNRTGRVFASGPLLADKPTRDGARSLTRALGLKINRIVIDPGHGGHDTGTIGPHGVMEKNICLDVALRLGRLIQQKLPGTQVIYTRKTDVFVPLEERTAIANQAEADLFLSIHANSSHDEAARGIETYYLNFTTSPEALETASRENALSDSSIHELQDLIKKIARNDKVEESQELATDIQSSLATQLRKISTAERNRGVKKAPFVVLIGADMPSVLAEISFLSNPKDERMLEKAAQRQRIAQGIFRGVESYLSSLNSLNYGRRKQTLVSDRQPVNTAASRDREQR